MIPTPLRTVHKWVLPNGLSLLYQQSSDYPLAAGGLLLRTGSLYERAQEAGLANFTVELLLRGTHRRTARQIAQEIEFIGASLDAQASEDYAELGFVTPVSHLERVLDILSDIVQEPAFPVSEVEKERTSILASLKSRKDTLFTLAYDTLNRSLYDGHPYGRPVEGTLETVGRFRAADLRRWHQLHVHPDQAVFSMVSSLPLSAAQKVIEKYFRHWEKPPSSLPAPVPLVVSPLRESQRVGAEAPFEQGYWMVGMLAPSLEYPAALQLKVLNTLFGGSMGSRLFVALREERGLAYEVSSFYPTHQALSQWVIYLGLPPGQIRTAERRVNTLLSDLQRRGPTRQELKTAVQMIKGTTVMDWQTRRRQAWYAAWWEFLGRGADYGGRFFDELESVTVQELHDLADRLLSQKRVIVEVVPK